MKLAPLTNEQVVREWSARCARFDRELPRGILRGLGFLAVAALPLLVPEVAAGYAMFLMALCLCVAWGLWMEHSAILMCPRCGEPPASMSQYLHPRRAQACGHCGCPLVDRSRRKRG